MIVTEYWKVLLRFSLFPSFFFSLPLYRLSQQCYSWSPTAALWAFRMAHSASYSYIYFSLYFVWPFSIVCEMLFDNLLAALGHSEMPLPPKWSISLQVSLQSNTLLICRKPSLSIRQTIPFEVWKLSKIWSLVANFGGS